MLNPVYFFFKALNAILLANIYCFLQYYRSGIKVLIDKGSYAGAEAAHPLNGIVYRIDYVLNNFEGLAQKYVAFSISREG